MRKFAFMLIFALLLTGCGTYTGTGAYTGGYFGSILGSAIGGITDGPRGSDVGTIVGMVGGAVVGAAIGNAKDNADKREVREHYEKVQRDKQRQRQDNRASHDDEGYYDPSNSGDDRLYDFDMAGNSSNERHTLSSDGSAVSNVYPSSDGIEIRNIRFLDANEDGAINSNETCRVVFEVYNHTSRTLYDLQPMVNEVTGSRRIYISPSVTVARLEPDKGVRYTAMVKSARMKNGSVKFNVAVAHNDRVVSNISEFSVATVK